MFFCIGVSIMLSGCDYLFSVSCRDCKSPPEAVSEMMVLGATITNRTSPAASSIRQEFVPNAKDSAVVGSVFIYFAPAPEHEFIEDFNPYEHGPSRFPYEFTLSELKEGVHEVVPFKEEYSLEDPDHVYHGFVSLEAVPASLLGTANHILKSWPTPVFPVRATHLELWHY